MVLTDVPSFLRHVRASVWHLAIACVNLCIVLGFPMHAHAQVASTREALDRLEEVMSLRMEDGTFDRAAILPLIVVSAAPIYEDSRQAFANMAIGSLMRTFGSDGVRVCQACMTPRVTTDSGRLQHSTGPVSLEEVRLLDDSIRGDSSEARTGVWIEETPTGLGIRLVDLRTGRAIYADNVTGDMEWYGRSERRFRMARKIQMRVRGESLTHAFIDLALFPSPQVSFDWTEQWGAANENLSGLSLSLFNPVLGIGPVFYRAFPEAFGLLLGGKLLMSLPTALVSSFTRDSNATLIDPLLTGNAVLRFPFGGSNYGIFMYISTAAKVGLGFSALNTSLLPVVP